MKEKCFLCSVGLFSCRVYHADRGKWQWFSFLPSLLLLYTLLLFCDTNQTFKLSHNDIGGISMGNLGPFPGEQPAVIVRLSVLFFFDLATTCQSLNVNVDHFVTVA